MLNSAASTLVSRDSNQMEKVDNDSQTMTSQRGHSSKETENLESQFATLKVEEENRMQRPHNSQITTATPTATKLRDTKQMSRKELARTDAERNKRSLPSTPRSLYGAPSSPTDINIAQNAKRSSTANGSSKPSSIDTGSVSTSRYSFDDGCKSPLPMAKQTHIAVYKFVARHDDEITLDNGDPVHVNKKCEDLWFEGVNLRTKKSGIFPSRYVSDILQEDLREDSVNGAQENQFSLSFLGSVEVFGFKGNDIICDAIKQIVKQHQLSSAPKPPSCTLDVSSRGIKIIEHLQSPAGRQGSVSSKRSSKRKMGKLFDKDSKAPISQSHFFALKNVTFCGCHPNNARFFAFITKHPEDQRFACHVFMSEFSTEPVANAVGRAFNEFYAEFLDYQAPVEDFYIE